MTSSWKRLKLGNGGLVINIDIAPDGTKVCSTDTSGGWRHDGTKWVQLTNIDRLPNTFDPHIAPSGNNGVDDIRIAPSLTSTIFMLRQGDLLKSTDNAATFVTTGYPTQPVGAAACFNSPTKAFGPYIGIDPANPNVVYASTTSRGLQRSLNGGTTFATVTTLGGGLPGSTGNNPAVPRTFGAATNSVAVGTGSKSFTGYSGLGLANGEVVQVWETSNPANMMIGTITAAAPTTFTLNVDTAFGSGSHSDWTVGWPNELGGGHRTVFDVSGGTISTGSGGFSGLTRTKNVFQHTYGVGTWRSTDGGETWTSLAGANCPSLIRRMAADPYGVLWVADDDLSFTDGNLKKWDGSWSKITPAGSMLWATSVAVDAANSPSKGATVVTFISGDREFVQHSVNGGASWNPSGGYNNRSYVSSGDVDWLKTNFDALEGPGTGCFFANCDAHYNAGSGELWTGAEGLWSFVPPTVGAAIVLTQHTKGIEEFIGNSIYSFPGDGGAVLMGTWDYPLFYSNSLDAYPTQISGLRAENQTSLLRGYSIDYVWNNPSRVIAIVQSGDGVSDYSCVSTNYGRHGTWSALGLPTAADKHGGQIAAADSSTFVFIGVQNAHKPKETTDGGMTWNDISIPGGTPTQYWGAIDPFATYCKALESDKGNGDVYLYNVNNGASSAIYKRTKATGLWSVANANPNFSGESNFNEQMISTGVTGHLFFTGGFGDYGAGRNPDTTKLFYFTKDGWTTKSVVPNFVEVHTVGVGAIAAGHTYPSINVAGWYNGVFGVWQCLDWDPNNVATGTWTKLGESYPLNDFQVATRIDGDKVNAAIVYMITKESGAFYYSPDVPPSPPPPPPPPSSKRLPLRLRAHA